MSGSAALEHFLQTDPDDAGCATTLSTLDRYVELVLAGGGVERRYPGVAVHLRVCGPCAEDFDGLLNAVRNGAG
jgi:hypothetical protein